MGPGVTWSAETGRAWVLWRRQTTVGFQLIPEAPVDLRLYAIKSRKSYPPTSQPPEMSVITGLEAVPSG